MLALIARFTQKSMYNRIPMDTKIQIILRPKQKDLGDGFTVRRTLPDVRKRMVGPFVFWDHMGPVELSGTNEMVVRAHPHIGLATITYLFAGEILHRDSLGNEQVIRPGEVNWMTAGRGIVHSERAKNTKLEGIQLWVALPEDKEDIAPSFIHTKQQALPHIEHNGVKLRLIAGKAFAAESPIPVFSDIFYLNGIAPVSSQFDLPLRSNQEGAVYLTEGEISVEGQTILPGTMVVFKPGESISFTIPKHSEFMLLGGEIFPNIPTVWWNLVSHSKAKIEQAKKDWREGRFPKVPNESEFIPLPES